MMIVPGFRVLAALFCMPALVSCFFGFQLLATCNIPVKLLQHSMNSADEHTDTYTIV